MKQRLSKRYLWAMVLGCLLYGMSFLLLFSRCHSLWGKVVSGLLGVLAVTLLPVFYGLCLQRQRPNGQVINRRAEACVSSSFACVGIATMFSLPLCCLLAGGGGAMLFTYTLCMVLLFHGALWYGFFILSGK